MLAFKTVPSEHGDILFVPFQFGRSTRLRAAHFGQKQDSELEQSPREQPLFWELSGSQTCL